MSPGRRRLVTLLALGLGLLATAGLIAWSGGAALLDSLAAVGWGLLGVAALHLLVMQVNALSLRPLLARTPGGSPGGPPSALRLLRLWWIGDAVNSLLPVAQIGGELVRARLLTRDGVAGAEAGAAVIATLTAGIVTQILFAAAGLLVLALLAAPGEAQALPWLALGLAVLAGAVWAFWRGQRRGLFLALARRLEGLSGGRRWRELTGGAAALDAALQALYGDRRAFLACCAWRLAGWLLGTLQVWLILALAADAGTAGGLLEGFVLESLGQAAKSAGFAVPGALGLQEGGFAGGAVALGLSAQLGLTVSLVKRGRDLLLGLPALLALQWLEGRRFLSRKA